MRLNPASRQLRLQLGIALMNANQNIAAENTLREAIDGVPVTAQLYQTGLHYLLPVMIRRGETEQLLEEFPEPPPEARDDAAAEILFARSEALQISGEAAKARQAMDRALAFHRDAASLVRSATLAADQNDVRLARSQAAEAMKLAPNDESALNLAVTLDLRTGDARKALIEANEYIRRVPHSLSARALRFNVLLTLNEDADAKRELDAIVKELPKSREASLYRSVLMARGKDFRGAWAQVQFLPPDYLSSRAPIAMTVAAIAVGSGYVKAGIAILSRFVAHNPDDRLVPLQLAAALLVDNSPQEALYALKPFDAHSSGAAALRAEAYLSLRQFGEAFRAFDAVSSLPKHSDLTGQLLTVRRMAFSRANLTENDQIIRGLQTLRDRIHADANVTGPLVAALIEAARWDEGLDLIKQMTIQLPHSPLPPFYRGQILVAQGNLDEAEAAFSLALRLDATFVPALYYRANVRAARGAFALADADLQALRGRAGLPATLRMAEIAQDRGAHDEALALLKSGMSEVSRADMTPRLALAKYQMSRGQYKDAQAIIAGVLDISPYDPEVQALKGETELLQGQHAAAAKTFGSLTTAANESILPGAYALLARTLILARDFPAAEEAIRTAIEWAPDSTQLQLQLIDIQLATAKTEAALDTARLFAKKYPGPESDLLESEVLLRLKRTNEGEAVLRASIGALHGIQQLKNIAIAVGSLDNTRAVLSLWSAASLESATAAPEGLPPKRKTVDLSVGGNPTR